MIPTFQALASLGLGLMVPVLTLVLWIVRRQGKEARDARRATASVAAATRWQRQVLTLAAAEGFDQHPLWPAVPKEMTLEYLMDAPEDPASPLSQLAATLQEMTKGKP